MSETANNAIRELLNEIQKLRADLIDAQTTIEILEYSNASLD